MTESTNYKFKLPSSADGVEDLADIEVISKNFSDIDEILHDLESNAIPCSVCPASFSLDVDFPQGIYKTTSTCTITNATAEGETVTIPSDCVFSYTRSMSVGNASLNGALIMLKGSMNAGGAGEQLACYVNGYKTDTWTYEFEFNGGYVTYKSINKKQNALVSGTNIKTINNQSILGSGNLTIESGEAIKEVTISGHTVTAGYFDNLDFSRYKLTSSDGENIIVQLRTGDYDSSDDYRAVEEFSVYNTSLEFNVTTTSISAILSKVINLINGGIGNSSSAAGPAYDTIIIPGIVAMMPDTVTNRVYEYEVDQKLNSTVGNINQVLATLVDVTTA